MGCDGDDALGRRGDHLQCVAGVGLACRFLRPSPQVDHRATLEMNTACRADIAMALEVGGERIPHWLEAFRDSAAELGLDGHRLEAYSRGGGGRSRTSQGQSLDMLPEWPRCFCSITPRD